MHSNSRIVSNRIVSARQNKKTSIVLSKCEGEDKKKKGQWAGGQVEMRRCRRQGVCDAMRCAMRGDVM